MKHYRHLATLLLLMSTGLIAGAQVPYFEHILLLKKNEPVFVNAMFQDHHGFLWYGTDKGLFKYDGVTVSHFTETDSLSENKVTAIAEDSLGRIWTGHGNGKLSFVDGNGIHAFNPPEGNATEEVSDILFDKNGNLWFSTLNDGLYYFTNGRLFRLDKDEGMPDIFVYDIDEDPNGFIWAGTDGGLVRCEIRDRKAVITVFDTRTGLPDNIIKKVIAERDGLLLGTEDFGVVSFNPEKRQARPLLPVSWQYGAINDFLPDEHEVWIASQQSGLIVFDRLSQQTKVFNAAGTGYGSILTLLKDREGNIWAGTKADVLRTRGNQLEFIDQFGPSQLVNTVALAADNTGAIWFATREGLFKRQLIAGKTVIEKPLAGTPYQRYSVISLYVGADGFVWAGLYGEGVLRIHPSGKIQRYLNKELSNGNVLHISGKGNSVWLATLGGGTRIRVNGEQLDIRNFTNADGLASGFIYQIYVDSKDRVWFATDGKGADMMDDQGFHHFQKGLNSRVIYGFAEDHNHDIWANVQGDGLYKLEGETFKAFDPDGLLLRNNNISCFSSTPSGDLFIIHDLGIDILNVDRSKVLSLGEEAGIRDKIPNLNAIASDGKGHLFAGTEGGIVKYTERSGDYATAPKPMIENLKVLNRTVQFDAAANLGHNQNDITIDYVGLWFQNPAAVSYQYKLDNYDREWIGSQNHSVTYSRLMPGSYTFRIRASDTRDFSGAAEASLSFEINPPYWQTLWFYAGVAVLAGVMLFVIIRNRERNLKDDKRVLEERVAERTLEIIQKNNEINNQAAEIRTINENLEDLVRQRTAELERKNKALEQYAFINAHELRAPVASILGLVQLMENGHPEEQKGEYVEHLRTSAEKLDNVVRSIGKAIERGG